MTQKNIVTGTIRDMRQPLGMYPPSKPVLPQGEFIVLTVTSEMIGKSQISVNNPKSGEQIAVSLPAKVKKGQKIAVPIPGKNESVEDVAKKQQGMGLGRKAAI